MSKAFEALRKGGPWSYAALVRRGSEDVLDDEGRPLAERRANATVRQGVPLILKSCPYHDERRGSPMNVTALAQVVKHLDPVLDALAQVRAAVTAQAPTWADVFTVVLDGLGAPALYLLRNPTALVVPGQPAVAHKLAAGYFAVVRDLFAEAVMGRDTPVTAEQLLAFAHGRKAFVGEGEVCAGPPHMIARATQVLVEGQPGAAPLQDDARVRIADLYRRQLQLSFVFEHCDRLWERATVALLAPVAARTAFFKRRIDERRDELDRAPAPPALDVRRALPPTTDAGCTEVLERALRGAPAGPARWAGLEDTGAGALALSPTSRAVLLERLAAVLDAQVAVLRELVALEGQIRAQLGPVEDPASAVDFGSAFFVRPTTIGLLEGALGVRVSCTTAASPQVSVEPIPRPVSLVGSTAAR